MVQNYYPKSALVLLNIALGLGTFIQVLDSSIANVAIPYIAGNLSVSVDEGTWVITSFSASNAVVLPLTGWLAEYFGRVRLFVWSVLLFALISFLCGFATSLTMLICLRVLQGAVAGSLIPLSQSLIVINNPPDNQGIALGFWGMIVIVAPILGPIIGGYLTYEYSWPWIFYINVPIGLFSAGITWYYLKDRESEIKHNPIDWFGLFLLSVGVACLQIMFDKGQDLDWFRSNIIIALLITSLVSLTYFAVWTYFQTYPIVDFSFFKNRNFAAGTIAITGGYLIYFGSTVTLPLLLQTQLNYTPFWAGVAVAPIGLVPFVTCLFVGEYMNRMDLRVLVSISFLLFSLGFFYQSNFIANVDLNTIMLSRFYQGFGVAIFFLPLVQLSLGQIPKERYANAAGLFNFIRILVGSGFGTSLSVAWWERREIYYHQRLGELITKENPEIIDYFLTLKNFNPVLSGETARGLLDLEVERQAYTLANNDLSWLAAWAFLVMIPIVFLCKRIRPSENIPAKHGGGH